MGEDEDVPRATLTDALKEIVIRYCLIVLWLPVSLASLPLFLLGLSIWGLPPIISPWSRFWKYFVAVFMEGTHEDNIPLVNRVIVFLTVLYTLTNAPLVGVFWFIDELLFPSYHKVDLKEPIFFISAVRSGSTQLAQYIEEDEENFIVPKVQETLCPFIWMWKLNIPPRDFAGTRPVLRNNMYAEKIKRHNANFDKTNTMGAVVLDWHFGFTSSLLGARFLKWGFPHVAPKDIPIDQQFCNKLLSFIECITRKIYYYRGKPSQHVLVKGHFLTIARTLEHRYPDAKFFTVVRDPAQRFQSTINFFRIISSQFGLSPASWQVLRDYTLATQIPYCEEEMTFYYQSESNKLVIPFSLYTNNLTATLEKIYSLCNLTIPEHMMSMANRAQHTSHDRSERRANYNPKLNRSLASMGVDEAKLREQLDDYINWIKEIECNYVQAS